MYRAAGKPSPSNQELAHELQMLWRGATADNIGPALKAARRKFAEAPPAVQAEVADLMASLENLERWLRDF